MVLAITSLTLQANAHIPRMSLFSAASAVPSSPSSVQVFFHHPHEAAVTSSLFNSQHFTPREVENTAAIVASERGKICLLLSEVGSYCHVSVAAVTQKDQTYLKFHDKFRIKTDPPARVGVGHGKTNVTRQGEYFTTASLFASRLQRELVRAVGMIDGEVEGAWDGGWWHEIRTVQFIIEGNRNNVTFGDDEDGAKCASGNNFKLWLEGDLLACIGGDCNAVSTLFPDIVEQFSANVLMCVAESGKSVLGCDVGIRVDNFTTTILEASASVPGAGPQATEAGCQRASYRDSNEFIPFIESSQLLLEGPGLGFNEGSEVNEEFEAEENSPVCVRRRLSCRRPNSGGGNVNLVLDVVEQSQCSYCGDSSTGGIDHARNSCQKGHVLHSLLSALVTVYSVDNTAPIEIDVEIQVHPNRALSLKVGDPHGDLSTSLIISSVHTSAARSLSGTSTTLRSIQNITSQADQLFVRDESLATRWCCDDLASDFKQRGNEYIQRGSDFCTAVEMYSSGLACASPGDSCGVLASNRCAAYMHLNALSLALLDAQDSVRHRPEWEKAWSRLGAVLFRLGRLQESLQAYEKASSIAPTNSATLDALQEVRDAVMVREAEAAAVEARKCNGSKRKSDDAQHGRQSDTKECNDVCVIS